VDYHLTHEKKIAHVIPTKVPAPIIARKKFSVSAIIVSILEHNFTEQIKGVEGHKKIDPIVDQLGSKYLRYFRSEERNHTRTCRTAGGRTI